MEIATFDCNSYWKRFKVMNSLGTLLHLEKDDTILFPGNYSSLRKHCNHLLVIHDLLYLRKNLMRNRVFRWQRILFVPWSILLADKVVTISKWVKSDVETNYPKISKDKIEAVYNYFDFNKYGDYYSDEIKQLISTPYFLVVSADYPHKNVGKVIEAFSRYAALDSSTKLIIVGKMSEERKNQIDLLPKEFKERISILKGISDGDLAQLYRKAKAYINATEFEGLGMPLVEAMYLGTKVVSSNIDVAKEVTDGKAIYFNSTNIDELYHILCHLDEYSQSENSIKGIAEKFSAKNTCGRYIEILNNINK